MRKSNVFCRCNDQAITHFGIVLWKRASNHQKSIWKCVERLSNLPRDVNDNLKRCFLFKIQGTANLKHVFYYPGTICFRQTLFFDKTLF